MKLGSLATKLRGSTTRERIPGVLSAADFRLVLDRERALADRHDLTFSLLVFHNSAHPLPEHDLSSTARALSRLLRKTDIAGWLPENGLGAILPFTPKRGAATLAERVLGDLSSDDASWIRYEVLGYPSEQEPGSALAEKSASPVLASAREEGESLLRLEAVETPLIDQMLAPAFPWWKRALDVLISAGALILLSPLLLTVATLIKIVSPGPVFFRQERVGYLRRKFRCWKFRTMHLNADVAVHEQHFKNLMASEKPMTKLDVKRDPRVIPLGRLLRASGIDELPQLINVLRGDMSFIGPRPSIEYEYLRYQRWQKRRCDARPGLTGLWQVNGKNRTTFNQMMRLDISYTRNLSPWMDFGILLRTFPAVVNEVRDTLSNKCNRP